jgi:hypothetical protein
METEKAIYILMHLDAYVEYDECFGIMVGAPLMDAVLLAIKALKAEKDRKNLFDAVEVVRCKDCKYWERRLVNAKGFAICAASGMDITADDFCSYGERRTEDG